MLPPPPPVLLILGTDAAGKDYVAEFLIRRWRAAGHRIEKRAGGFAAPAADARSSSERKGRWGRFRERAFLGLFPLLHPLLPAVARLLLARDRRRFRPSAVPLVVVSHTALRLLALVLGQQREGADALARRPSPGAGTRPARGGAARHGGRGARRRARHPPPADRRPDSIRHRRSFRPLHARRPGPRRAHRALSGGTGDPLPE